jgi:hypothetical protein
VSKRYAFLPPGVVLPTIMSITETVSFTKISRTGVYAKIKAGSYRTIKTGRRTGVITTTVLDDMEKEIAAAAVNDAA